MPESNNYEALRKEGYQRASEAAGHPEVLKSHLKKCVADTVEKVNEKSEVQKNQILRLNKEAKDLESEIEKLKDLENQKTEDIYMLLEEIENFEINFTSEKGKSTERIAEIKLEIEGIKNEIENLYSEDNETKKPKAKVGFIVANILITFLTTFLWLFYVSAMHSAYIRNVQEEYSEAFSQNAGIGGFDDEIDVSFGSTIFNPKAFKETINQGIYGFLYLFVAPGLLFAAGFLIYAYRDKKRIVWTVYIGTFIYDCFLAFHIVRDIHIAQFAVGLENTEWADSLIFSKLTFYMILMTGFVGYVMWGLIFNYIITEREKEEPFKKQIRTKEELIDEYKKQIVDLENELRDTKEKKLEKKEELNSEISELKKQITETEEARKRKLNEADIINDQVPIPKTRLEAEIDQFFSGWIKWIVDNNKGLNSEGEDGYISTCAEVKEGFLTQLFESNDYFFFSGNNSA